jgi:hypothetical protein
MQTIEEATAYIANREQMRQATEKINEIQSQNSMGAGHSNVMQQPLILSRVIQHNELIFNLASDKNTHLIKGAGEKWTLNKKCWLCDKARYTVIVFNRELADKYFTQVTDADMIS